MTHDFLIIGGGIAGVSTAARLSHLGTVCLLEAEPALAYHASGRSAALFEPNYGNAPTVALSHASDDHLHNATGVLSPRGLLFLAGRGEEALLDADITAMDLTSMSVTDARAMVPIIDPSHVTAAAYHAGAWDIDTDLMVQNFAREARRNGATITNNAHVTAITRQGRQWSVTTATQTCTAHTLVNAAGAWADQIAEMAGIPAIGLNPLRRSMARIPAPGGHDVSAWPMLIGAGETWYAKPDAGKWLISPAEEDPVDTPHDAWADDMVLAEGIARYQPYVTEEVTRLETSWAGLRTFAPDRTLVLGPAPDAPDFIWVAGQGGYGFQTAPAASQLIADLVAGRIPTLDAGTVAALSPARFA
jgi:D-arginine dehydrogenase